MSHFQRVHSLSSTDDVLSLYNDWATTYEKEMTSDTHGYIAPAIASAHVLKCLGSSSINKDVIILDAGCGTGLVGTHLSKFGAKSIDGLDLSPGMLEIARKTNAYKSLRVADLSQRLPCEDGLYDVVVCVGTLTQGHVGPEAIAEFVRVTKPGGFVVATVRADIWESGGYKAQVERLVSESRIHIISAEVEKYRPKAGVSARMVVLQVSE